MSESKVTELQLSSRAEEVLQQLEGKTMMGHLRKVAKEIKKDHELALELWSTGEFYPRMLAILIMDKNLLTEEDINQLVEDMYDYDYSERNKLMDWLMANQLTKDKKKIAIIESWENSSLSLQRRIYWYYQGRLRWTGKTPANNNTEELLTKIEARIMDEEPEVQFVMNLTAGWIGVYDETYRERCIKLGERTGLYQGEHVSKGCTPSYLPEFISIEYNKLQNK